MKKHDINNQNGAAMLVAIIIMMIVIMLASSLLLISFSLFRTSNKEYNQRQCREMALSIAQELGDELTEVSFHSLDEQTATFNAGKSPLWFYLRCNVGQTSWPYYAEGERGHDSKAAFRRFTLKADGTNAGDWGNAVDDGKAEIVMYWESEQGADVGGSPLVMRITCEKAGQKATVTLTQELVVENTFAAPAEGEPDSIMYTDSTVNPSGNRIKKQEKWSWGGVGIE